jgi:hypothetical protein
MEFVQRKTKYAAVARTATMIVSDVHRRRLSITSRGWPISTIIVLLSMSVIWSSVNQ